jgi:hypothetical protein
MTQQQGIVDAIAAMMATVTGVVTVTKNRPLDEPYGLNHLPAINVIAAKAEVIQEHSAGTDERLTIILSVFCSGATAANATLDYLAAALAKIGANETYSAKALDSRKTERATAVRQAEATIAETHQMIEVDYRTPRWGL